VRRIAGDPHHHSAAAVQRPDVRVAVRLLDDAGDARAVVRKGRKRDSRRTGQLCDDLTDPVHLNEIDIAGQAGLEREDPSIA
jgi:hypothetical protein